MSIKKLAISGLRGFASEQTLNLAIPNGKSGGGLTILVGPNNGGKSTVIEAFKALSSPQPTSFALGRRNQKTKGRIQITATTDGNAVFSLGTVDSGGSQTVWSKPQGFQTPSIFVLPSRRFFSPSFGQQIQARQSYIEGYPMTAVRGSAIDQFAGRLFEIQKNRTAFDAILKRVLDPLPTWTIDQSEAGYFLRFEVKGTYHSSEGLGEGLLSLFFIVDALYDAPDGSVIVIDEPELSLHPPLQRKLRILLSEWSQNRQIILATHSPYFVDFSDVVVGAKVARVHIRDSESKISNLSDVAVKQIDGFLKNRKNPHILGIDAREVFFLADNVILVEGQEDVISYPEVAAQLKKEFTGQFFGWGVGGAENMTTISSLLHDLGFVKVVGLLDSNKEDVAESLRAQFPNYRFFTIPANDVRTKSAQPEKKEVVGLLDEKEQLRDEFRESTAKLIDDVSAALK
jgi:predicted ATP-dependent endonuclease of OLD family